MEPNFVTMLGATSKLGQPTSSKTAFRKNRHGIWKWIYKVIIYVNKKKYLMTAQPG